MRIIFRIFLCLLTVLFVFLTIFLIFGALIPEISELTDDFNRNLPKYSDKVEYIEGGFDDFEEYKEFYYSKDKIAEFENSKYFKKVDEDDIENISGFFEYFENNILPYTDYKDKYKFDRSQIKTGDYYYIKTKYDNPYDNYDVYYVDTKKCIMYFIHSNL